MTRTVRGELVVGPLGAALGPRAAAVLGTLAAVAPEGIGAWDEGRAAIASPVPALPQLFATGWDFFGHQVRRALRGSLARPVHVLAPLLVPGSFAEPVHVPVDGEPPVCGSLAMAAEDLRILRDSYRVRFEALVRGEASDRVADVDSRDGREDLMRTLLKVCAQGVALAEREGLPLVRR